MAELGKFNQLKVIEMTGNAVYLDGENYGDLFFVKEQLIYDCKAGDIIDVFLYSDSQRGIIPTPKKPNAVLGEFALMRVVDVLEMGAFLDWGLPKDLFCPIGKQKEPMEKGESYVVYLYKDERQNRIAATSKLDQFLDQTPPKYQRKEEVDLVICNETDIGYKAIINQAHWGLIYKDEVFQPLSYGQKIKGYVKLVREEGGIDLSLQPIGYQKMDALEEKILEAIKNNGGTLKITDKSDPEMIYKTFGVSKKKYKMALGALYKAKRIVITDDLITLQK